MLPWLLMTHDRVQSDRFILTQEFLGMMLGVRRTSITLTAKQLKRQKLIDYSRGHVHILDRPGLEHRFPANATRSASANSIDCWVPRRGCRPASRDSRRSRAGRHRRGRLVAPIAVFLLSRRRMIETNVPSGAAMIAQACPACRETTPHRLLYRKNGCDIRQCRELRPGTR